MDKFIWKNEVGRKRRASFRGQGEDLSLVAPAPEAKSAPEPPLPLIGPESSGTHQCSTTLRIQAPNAPPEDDSEGISDGALQSPSNHSLGGTTVSVGTHSPGIDAGGGVLAEEGDLDHPPQPLNGVEVVGDMQSPITSSPTLTEHLAVNEVDDAALLGSCAGVVHANEGVSPCMHALQPPTSTACNARNCGVTGEDAPTSGDTAGVPGSVSRSVPEVQGGNCSTSAPTSGAPKRTHPVPQVEEMPIRPWMRTRMAVRRTIPRSSWDAWGGCFADACLAVVESLRGSPQQLDEAMEHLLLLPRTLLGNGRSGSRTTRAIDARCSGDSPPLPAGPASPRNGGTAPSALSNKRVSAHRRADRALQFLQAGRLTLAADAVDAAPPAEATPDVVAQLQELHPRAEAPLPVHPPPLSQHLRMPVDVDLLASVVKALPRLASAGPSGMCFEHIRAAVIGNERALPALRQLVNAALTGHLTGKASTLLASCLVALPKPGGGVRPLAVGEVLCRVISICAVRLAKQAPAALAPIQLGVGVPGAIETALHSVRAAMRQHPDWLVVTLDWRNAFNSVSRRAVLRSVAHVLPELSGWANTLYTQHSALITSGGAVLSSQQGVRQGDPFSPLAFDLAIQPLLNAANAKAVNKGGHVGAYHDDVFVMGPPEAVASAVHQIRVQGASIGLQLQPSKCKVTSVAAQEAARQFADEQGFKHSVNGLELLGAAVGKDAFLTAACEGTVKAVDKWVDTLMSLPLPAQAKMLLLRDSGGAKLAHLPRWLPPAVAKRLCQPRALHLLRAMAQLAGVNTFSVDTARLAALPTRLGGLGICVWDRYDCSVAYVAGAGAASRIMHQYGVTQWLPLANSAPDPALQHAMESLADMALPLETPLEHCPTRWQSALMERLHEWRHAKLCKAMPAAAQARLYAAGTGGAGAWMRAMPVGALALTDREVQLGLKLWLGLHIRPPLPPDQAPHRCCVRKHQHPLNCPLVDEPQRQAEMLRAWVRVMRVAGVAVRQVPTTCLRVHAPVPSKDNSAPDAHRAPAQPESSEPSLSCSPSADAGTPNVRKAARPHLALETGFGGTAQYVVPWIGHPKQAAGRLSFTNARAVPCNWLGAPSREAKNLLRMVRRAAEGTGIPGWAFDAWSRQCLSVAAVKANVRALDRHVAAARGIPQHNDAWASEVAATLELQHAAPADSRGVSAVPGAPEN